MADQTKKAKVLLEYELNEQKFKRIEQTADKFKQQLRDSAVEAKRFDLGNRSAADGIKAFTDNAQKAQSRLGSLNESVKSSLLEFDRIGEAARNAGDAIKDAEEKSGKFNTGNALSKFSQLASPFSPQLAQGLNFAGDISDTVPKLGELKTAITGLGSAGLIAAATVGAAAIAVAVLNEQNKGITAGVKEITERERVFYELRVAGTTKSIQAAIEEAKFEQQVAQARVDDLKYVAQGYEETGKQLGFFTGGIIELGGALGIANLGDIRDAKNSYNEANDALTKANANLALYTGLLDDTSTATNDAAEHEKELAKRRQEAYSELFKLNDQAKALQTKANDDAIDIADERRVRDERAQEDFNASQEAAEKAHYGRLGEIAAQGKKRIQDADAQITKLGQSLTDVASKFFSDKQKIEADYMKSELTDLAKFRDAEEKATAQYNKERKRRLEDLNDELLDAESANDVVRFIAAQKAAEKDLNRSKEDFDDATKERQAQYDQERAERQGQLQERLAQLEVEASARRSDFQKQIEERQAAKDEILADIKAQKDAENARYKESNDAAQKAFDLRKKRQDEDDRRADNKRAEVLASQLAEIEKKKQAELAAAGIVKTAWIAAGNAIAAGVRSALGGIGSGSSNKGNSGSGGGGGTKKPTAFAYGGIVTKPTIGLMAERPGYNEAAIPFRKTESLGAALARMGLGGPHVAIYGGPVTVGDIASMRAVQDMIAAENAKLGQAVINGIAQAQAGAA